MGGRYVCTQAGERLSCEAQGGEALEGELDVPDERWAQVVGGQWHLCGVTVEGRPRCWGWNQAGQGDVPVDLDVGELFLGYEDTCNLSPTGALRCWGNPATGIQATPPGAWRLAAAAERVACAWGEAGWGCWGAWWEQAELEPGVPFDWSLPEEPPVALAGGSTNLCALDAAGRISCWGRADTGVTEPPEGAGWREVSVGVDHACALTPDDELRCWGALAGTPPPGPWRTARAGPFGDCGLRRGGRVECWN